MSSRRGSDNCAIKAAGRLSITFFPGAAAQDYTGATCGSKRCYDPERLKPESVELLREGLPMRFKKSLFVLAVMLVATAVAMAQDKTLGGIKGKVRVETGTPGGVTVIVRRGDKEVSR